MNFIQEGKGKDSAEVFDGHYAFSIIPSMERTAWIIDSGASTHVCCDKEILHTIYRLNTPIKVHLPDGSSREVMVAGKVRLTKDIVLTDVLFVPGFTNNLLSVAQLLQGSGIRCIFYPTHCLFKDTYDNRTIAAGRMERNLYIFETTVENH